MLKVADLTPEQIEKIKTIRYDYLYEKHEGPWRYSDVFDWDYHYQEFMELGGYTVLLPIQKEQAPNIKPQRIILSADHRTLIIYYLDTTWSPQGDDMVAICEQMPGEVYYIATFLHVRYPFENPVLNTPPASLPQPETGSR
jgi:hypothetical protein